MQTFLPHVDPRASVAALDDRRLGKQRVETYQILRALTWPRYAWKNHPAVRMWRGFVPALVAYGLAGVDEWVARGRADATRASLLAWTGGREPGWDDLRDAGQLPPWLGSAALHLSHRAALLRKDPGHYGPLFPGEPDDLPYHWPATPFPRWPLRRPSRHSVEPDAATALLGLEPEDLPADVLDAVRDVRAGTSAAVSAGGELALRAGLLAAWCRPGRALWVVPGAALPPTGPAPAPHPAPGGRVAAVTARPPTPEDERAMAAEAAAEPDTAFVRRGEYDPSGPLAVRAGVLVLDGVDVPVPDGVPVLRLRSPYCAARLEVRP